MRKLLLLFLLLSVITIRTVRIGQDLRMVVIFTDEKGVHWQYYTERDPHLILGEEIFMLGEKIFDNYTENDGLRVY
jgi:hypothetical protein